MEETKKYWKGLEELNNTPEFQEYADKEFAEYLPVKENRKSDEDLPDGGGRRDFLKLMGFSVAAASLVACETPLKKVIPYVNKPQNLEPGTANWYASSFVNGGEYCSVLVKTREGRPVKIEGNASSTISQGGVGVHALASLLDLYDSSRYKTFLKKDVSISKKTADKEIKKALKAISSKGGNIRIVSQSILSPSTKSVINEFIAAYPGTKHVAYDPTSASGLISANGGLPSYRFDKADVIVSFGADFLSTWISPVQFSKDYSKNRKVQKGHAKMSKHYQFETAMSLTGSNADVRVPLKPSEEPYFIAALYNKIASQLGASKVALKDISGDQKAKLDEAAAALLKNKGKSLVVSGSNDTAVQTLVAKINELLNNVGSTIDADRKSLLKQGDDQQMISFVEELTAGKVDGVIFFNANPVYDHAYADKIEEGLKKVGLKISFASKLDETAAMADYVCPDLHPLESWGDAEPIQGSYSIIQPAITPLFDQPSRGWENRSAQESLLTWAGNKTSYYDYVKAYWEKNLFSLQSKEVLFSAFWFNTVQEGVFQANSILPVEEVVADEHSEDAENEVVISEGLSLGEVAKQIKHFYKPSVGKELVIYESAGVGTGAMANNPWVQELPDPVSKVTWDNYVAINMFDAQNEGLKNGDVIKITVKEKALVKLPVLIQPGQARGTVAVALGYGREKAGPLAAGILESNKLNPNAIGVNVYPFLTIKQGNVSYSASGVEIQTTGNTYPLAQTQTHQTLMARPIVLDATLDEYKANNAHALANQPRVHTSKGVQKPNEVDIWQAPSSTSAAEYEEQKKAGISQEVITHAHPNHHWGMVIDLNSCTGCSACMISCQSENNVPVVGKDEVLRRREMHWIRIDRYYATDAETGIENQNISGYKEMEIPGEYPKEVTFQPMMCQHCNHAPCETVCPVAATNHSSEGLNQMAYNRCIGTRYCANNCPYKVRRFNWFNYSDSTNSGREFPKTNYAMNDDLGKMVLNPDVTVRARGTMEKCSMCVQRIQEGKLKAKISGKKVEDGQVVTACASVCPTDAIVFGDMNDPNSQISKVREEQNQDRNYHVLEDLNVKPNVSYLAQIRNS